MSQRIALIAIIETTENYRGIINNPFSSDNIIVIYHCDYFIETQVKLAV